MPAADTAPLTEALPGTRRGKGRYTYADYAKLPEGAPYELIHGHLVMSPSPTTTHQRLVLQIARMLGDHADEHTSDEHTSDEHTSGQVFIAPIDVFLSETDTVQPDVLFVASDRAHIIEEQRINGAPDLIVEVFSPSTTHRDVGVKKRLYETHGVREYWTVDPETQAVEVHVNTAHGFDQHARVVESGTVASALLDGFAIDLEDLF